MMTREEMQRKANNIVRALSFEIEDGNGSHRIGGALDEAKELLAALEAEKPCASAGRRPLAVVRGYTTQQQLDWYCDGTDHELIIRRCRGISPLEPPYGIEIDGIILPAKEKPTP